jgi:hypothetical protein
MAGNSPLDRAPRRCSKCQDLVRLLPVCVLLIVTQYSLVSMIYIQRRWVNGGSVELIDVSV